MAHVTGGDFTAGAVLVLFDIGFADQMGVEPGIFIRQRHAERFGERDAFRIFGFRVTVIAPEFTGVIFVAGDDGVMLAVHAGEDGDLGLVFDGLDAHESKRAYEREREIHHEFVAVALLCGFDGQSHCQRAENQHEGVRPGEFFA